MGRKLIINSNNEITTNTLNDAKIKFRKTIERILSDLRKGFDDEEDVDSDSSVQ